MPLIHPPLTVHTVKIRPLSVAAVASVPVVLSAAAVAGSVQAFRRLGAHPFEEPSLPGLRLSAPLPSGGSVGFRLSDAGEGIPLVFLHGWGSCSDATWFSVLPLLDRPFLAVDHPGHGLSSRDGEFSFERAAEAVLTAIDAAGFEKVHLVAHSMGGGVALETLRQDSSRVERVTMVATTAFFSSPLMSLAALLAPHVISNRSPVLVRGILREIEAFPDHARSVAWAWRNRPEEEVLLASARTLRSFDARTWEGFTMPRTLWVIPEEDRVIRPQLQHVSARHFGHDVLSLEAAGHSFFLHDPQLLLDAFTDVVPG